MLQGFCHIAKLKYQVFTHMEFLVPRQAGENFLQLVWSGRVGKHQVSYLTIAFQLIQLAFGLLTY